MDFIDAILLGLVEGITEFLPISSTGHMILTSHLLGLNDEATKTFEIMIQLGAILSVMVLYWHRIQNVFSFSKNDSAVTQFRGKSALLCLGLTSLPVVVLGLALRKIIKAYLFGPVTVVAALAVGGVLMIILERLFKPKNHTTNLDTLSYKQALGIGLFQCLALWPGMSRSASTIIGGMLMGVERKVAAEYSFLAAIPIMFLATGYDLFQSLDFLSWQQAPIFMTGFLVAFVSALLAVKLFIRLLQHQTLIPYGIYRVMIAVIMAFSLASGH